ncbi:MAG TPA: phenylalanine--tRNA ligase subunit alpha, partial [Ktedonobacterales bacterium]
MATDEERQLEVMRERARAELEHLDTTEALEDWRTRYLGRERGELTAVLKGLGKLPGEQRKIVGQAANAVKTDLEALLEARRQAVQAQERAAILERERVDVTLPGAAMP